MHWKCFPRGYVHCIPKPSGYALKPSGVCAFLSPRASPSGLGMHIPPWVSMHPSGLGTNAHTPSWNIFNASLGPMQQYHTVLVHSTPHQTRPFLNPKGQKRAILLLRTKIYTRLGWVEILSMLSIAVKLFVTSTKNASRSNYRNCSLLLLHVVTAIDKAQ